MVAELRKMRDPNSAGNKKPEEKKFHQLGLVALWQVRLKRARYEKCATGYCRTAWLICAEILLTIIFMQSRGQLKGQKFWAAVGASPENISAHHPKIFLENIPKASAENIFGHPPEIFWPVWNNFYATRLTRCDRFGFGGFNPCGIFIVLGNLKHS